MKKISFLSLWTSLFLSLASSVTAQFTFIPRSAPDWRYLDNGSDQGTAWTQPSFDDASWPLGTAEFGYGDGDEATVVSFGPDPFNRFVTTYFRKHFWVTNSAQWTNLIVRLLRDDGAVVYLNGTEVMRHNMPAGAINYQTLATATVNAPEEATFFEQLIPALLVNGQNTIAVEIHQVNVSSSDISFNLELVGIAAGGPIRPTFVEHPQSQTVQVGGTAIFHVTVAGTPPFGYRWRRNGITIVPFGVGTDTLIISNVQPSHAGVYNVIVTNAANPAPGVLSSNAVLTVIPVNQAPIARIQIENTVTFLDTATLITLDASADVILDGSQSSDPENNPLTFTWFVGDPPQAFATGVRVTNEVATGNHLFQLQVSDGELTGIAQAPVDVLTPCDAIALLILRIEESSHPNGIKNPLIDELETSCNHFDKGRIEQGIESLEIFQDKVADKLGDVDPAFAELLIEAAQTLIDAVSAN